MPDLEVRAKINKDYKPTDEEQNWRQWVYKRYTTMKEDPERVTMEKEWEAGEKAWDAFREPKSDGDWESNYYIPLTTSVVESVLSEFIDQRIRPLILPRASEDISRAKVMRHIFDFTWDVADGDLELFDVLKSTLIRGTGIAQEYYLKDRRMVRDITGLNNLYKKGGKKNQFGFTTEEREVFEFDGCMMENVSIWDFYVDEKARTINRGPYKARDCIRRYVMNIRDFRTFFTGPVWDPMDRAKHVKPGGDTNYYQFYKPPEGIDHSEDVEVLWYWARSPEDALIIVANDVVVRMGPSIFRHKQLPFGRSVDVTRMDKFYGKGEPKLLESIQEELNTLRRMTIDRHHLDLDKSFLVSQTTQLDDEDLIARPHALIPVDDPRNVKALEYGDIPNSVNITQKAISEDSVRVTGVDDRFQALQKTPSTATEAAILKESTLKRIRMKIMLLTEGFLKDIAKQRVANIMQFYSQPKLEKIIGEEGTREYERQLARLTRDGLLEVRGGVPYEKKFPEIRLENKELAFNERGEVTERKKMGFSFFEAKPEYYMPLSGLSYDIRFEAGSTLPISKPLLQSKSAELFDRLLPLTEATNYDPEKLGDMLVEAHDKNPNELKSDPEQEETQATDSDARMEMAVQIATQENEEVMRGGKIPANGTPYAPPVHTEVHAAFIKSPQAKQMGDEQYKILVRHAAGEMVAQLIRKGVSPAEAVNMARQMLLGEEQALPPGGETAPGQTPEMMGNADNELAATMPGRIQGGNEVQTGLPPGPARIQ
jgi:hypothetical protein